MAITNYSRMLWLLSDIFWLLYLSADGFPTLRTPLRVNSAFIKNPLWLSPSDNLLDLGLMDGGFSSSPSLGAWVPVGSVSCLDGLDPTQVEIMGRKFVVWNPKSEEWSVLLDECPHRLSPLSLGRIDPVTKRIECPLHGWQFDGNGTLQSIPQLDPTASLCSESRSVESYATHVRGDLLWVFLPTLFHGESFPESILPEDYYPDWINTTFYTQELPFSYDFLVERYVWALCHCLGAYRIRISHSLFGS
jgi:nitrite reductase/ring-hydroxylating ferredoxin subunit